MNEAGNFGNICAETVPAKRKRGFVYFITDGEAMKIGFSHWPEKRIGDLQVGHSKPLSIVASFAGYMHEEQELHRRFSSLCVQGEWFAPAQELTDFIAELEGARRYMDRHVVNITDVLRGAHRDKIAMHEFPGKCIRLARFIERSLHEMPPEHQRIATFARLSALMANQRNFWKNKTVVRLAVEDISAFEALGYR